jgi:hypothetical protein
VQTVLVGVHTEGRHFDIVHAIPRDPEDKFVRFTATISYENIEDFLYACHGPMNLCR